MVSSFRKTAQLKVATLTRGSNHLLHVDDVISLMLMLRSLDSTFHIHKVDTAHRHACLLIGAKKL